MIDEAVLSFSCLPSSILFVFCAHFALLLSRWCRKHPKQYDDGHRHEDELNLEHFLCLSLELVRQRFLSIFARARGYGGAMALKESSRSPPKHSVADGCMYDSSNMN